MVEWLTQNAMMIPVHALMIGTAIYGILYWMVGGNDGFDNK